MDLNVRTRGRHSLSTMNPMEYCWVASNYATALNKNQDFDPDDNEIMAMLFSGYIDRYSYRISYSAIRLCCLIFEGNTLLVFRPRYLKDDVDFNIPNVQADRSPPRMTANAEADMRLQGSIHGTLFNWGESIVDDIKRLHYARPSMLYHTITDRNPPSKSSAEQHVKGIVAAMFHYSVNNAGERAARPRKRWNFNAFYFHGFDYEDDEDMVGRWLTFDEVKTTDWEDPLMQEVALLAFRAYNGEEMSAYGCETGKLYTEAEESIIMEVQCE